MAFRRRAALWSLVGSAGFLLLPWYAVPDGFLGMSWLAGGWADRDVAPAVLQAIRFGRLWLIPPGLALAGALTACGFVRDRRALGPWLIALGAAGVLYTLAQGFAIGLNCWPSPVLERILGPLADRQSGMGMGAVAVCSSFLFLLSTGLAARGAFRGDGFVAGAVVLVAVLVGLFTLFPVVRILSAAVQADGGAPSPAAFTRGSSLGRSGGWIAWPSKASAAWPGTRSCSRSSRPQRPPPSAWPSPSW